MKIFIANILMQRWAFQWPSLFFEKLKLGSLVSLANMNYGDIG